MYRYSLYRYSTISKSVREILHTLIDGIKETSKTLTKPKSQQTLNHEDWACINSKSEPHMDLLDYSSYLMSSYFSLDHPLIFTTIQPVAFDTLSSILTLLHTTLRLITDSAQHTKKLHINFLLNPRISLRFILYYGLDFRIVGADLNFIHWFIILIMEMCISHSIKSADDSAPLDQVFD